MSKKIKPVPEQTETTHRETTSGQMYPAPPPPQQTKKTAQKQAAKTFEPAHLPLPKDIIPYVNRAKEVWCECTSLKGSPRFPIDDMVVEALLTDYLHRIGRPKDSLKDLKLRLRAEAYKNAEMVRDPLEDTLTNVLYSLARQMTVAGRSQVRASQLEQSAFLKAIHLKLDASSWPKKNWFARAVRDRIEDLAQLGVNVEDNRDNDGQLFAFTLITKQAESDANDAFLKENDVSEVAGTEATQVAEKPEPTTLIATEDWKTLHSTLTNLRKGPHINLLLIGSEGFARHVVTELLMSAVCEHEPESFGCRECAMCKFVGVFDEFTSNHVSEQVFYCYLSCKQLTENHLYHERSAVQSGQARRIVYLEGIDELKDRAALNAVLDFIQNDDRVSWIASCMNVRQADERLLELFGLDVHLKG